VIDLTIAALLLGGLYALIAQGLSIVFGVMRVVNLAHGELFIVGAYAGWLFNEYTGLSPLAGLPIIAAAGAVIGWAIGRLVIGQLVDRPPLTALLATFGLGLAIQTVLRLVFGASPRFARTDLNDVVWRVAGQDLPAVKVVTAMAAVVVLFVMVPFIRFTKSGRAMRAVAQNTEGARIVGINLRRVYSQAMALGTAVVFVAGALFGMTQAFFPFSGAQFTLKAFIIVVLAGVSSGAWLLPAATLLAAIEVFCAGLIPGQGTSIGITASFVLVVAVLALRAGGPMNAEKGALA